MRIARILAPVKTLGPGNRVGIWLQGCSRKCYKCISPELQTDKMPEVPVELIADLVKKAADVNHTDSLTISGGDPFEQADELVKFLKMVRRDFRDILVYTGYTLAEIEEGKCRKSGIEALNYIDVLIDGPYVDEKNTETCVLRGSENQVIHFFKRELEPEYNSYMKAGRKIQTFSHNGEIIWVGISNREE